MKGGTLIRHPLSTLNSWTLFGEGDEISWEKIGKTYKRRSDLLQARPNDELHDLVDPKITRFSLKGLNQWVVPIIEHLAILYPSQSEPYKQCSRPIKHILQSPSAIDKSPLLDLTDQQYFKVKHVSKVDLMEDLTRSSKLKITESYTGGGQHTPASLLGSIASTSLGSAAFNTNRWWILGALNIPPHEKGSKFIALKTPLFLMEDGDISEVEGGYCDRSSAIMCAGFLTEPHYDYYGVPSLITHVFGRKLWFVWPATLENLEIAAKFLLDEGLSEKFTIEVALGSLKGLQLFYCTEQDDAFILEPYAIHAVISETNCGHTSKLFTSYSVFGTWDSAHTSLVRMLVKSCKKAGNDRLETLRVVDQLQEGLRGFLHWESLLKHRPGHTSAFHTRSRLAAIEEEVQAHIADLSNVGRKRKQMEP